MHAGLLNCGFTSLGHCGEWRSVYFHYGLKALVIVYVDDFKLAGPSDALKKAWNPIETVKITEDDGEQVEATVCVCATCLTSQPANLKSNSTSNSTSNVENFRCILCALFA